MLSTSFSIALSALALAQAPPVPLPPDHVARVGDQPILKTDYDHWLEGEAALQGITVSTRRVNAEYRRQKRESFPKERDFRRFLRTSGQTIADVKYRVRIDLFSERIRDRVVGDAKTLRGEQRRLERFVLAFTARWKAQTVCLKGYDTDDCGSVVVPTSA